MFGLLALLMLVLAGAAHAIAFVVARRTVARFLRADSVGLAVARGFAGLAGWYLAGSLLFAIGDFGRGENVIDETSMRVHVAAAGPAARAGVQNGDRIVKVAGEPITSWDQLRSVVSGHGAEPVAIDIDRAGTPIMITATPEGSPPKLLVGPWFEQHPVSIGHAIGVGLVQPGKIVVSIFRQFVRSSGVGESAELSGPVGIVRETSNTAKNQGIASGLLLAAALAAYVLPFVALATALFEIFSRRRRSVG